MPSCHFTLTGPKPCPLPYPAQLNTIGDHIRKRRLDLGLLQQEVAEQIGVAEATITNWELNHPSPDGRRTSDFISYGIAPSTIAPGSAHTAVLRSASHVAQDLCACGCPLTLSLSPGDVDGEAGVERLRDLVRSYFRMGGFHLHVNIVRADKLRDAQAHPDRHADLLVRVSGFSARFVSMDRPWQDAIVRRTELGM